MKKRDRRLLRELLTELRKHEPQPPIIEVLEVDFAKRTASYRGRTHEVPEGMNALVLPIPDCRSHLWRQRP